MKIVINVCYGGFSLSNVAATMLANQCNGGVEIDYNIMHKDEFRTNEYLIRLIETEGSEFTSGSHAKLAVIDIPDNLNWEIAEYDGMEHVIASESPIKHYSVAYADVEVD